MFKFRGLSGYILIAVILFTSNSLYSKETTKEIRSSDKETTSQLISVQYHEAGMPDSKTIELPVSTVSSSGKIRITTYRNESYQVIIHEICRESFTEINGELEHLAEGYSCTTLNICIPYSGASWKWFRGLDKSVPMETGHAYYDTISVRTLLPPDGAFNGKDLAAGGYGDPVGQGKMSYYPLCAISIDEAGKGLGVDMSLPVVYRLGADNQKGLFAEFDLATSPLTKKFPNRAFFKLCRFDFNQEWGMRAALEHYYSIYPDAFKKRVVTEGIWLPFTALRSIPGWEDFGFAFHETSWGSKDEKDGEEISHFLSDKGTGVLSFQYTEPWDIQLPIKTKTIPYDTLVNGGMISKEHRAYLDISATEDKNGLWQTRRLQTPWFKTGWAVSITTNCDPDLAGFNRYQYVLDHEISQARNLNADGIYFDSMEWNWHHDLNYREEHFAFTDYPLTFSGSVAKPAIWNFTSEFEFMKKISDEMHSQGKLAMGNGHGWNPFAAANLDLFGAELSWYSSNDHNIQSLDFKRAISFQKPIVFLLNEGLNDKAFTDAPHSGYAIYFEKLMAYGFFPSFFSTDASSDPYWQDHVKTEIGKPFFKKYIPIIKQIASAGWEPVTDATVNSPEVRIERFGNKDKLFFTVRNNGNKDVSSEILLDLKKLGITKTYSAFEMVGEQKVIVEQNRLYLKIPANRTQVINITYGD